jgi:hypothetical protein
VVQNRASGVHPDGVLFPSFCCSPHRVDIRPSDGSLSPGTKVHSGGVVVYHVTGDLSFTLCFIPDQVLHVNL